MANVMTGPRSGWERASNSAETLSELTNATDLEGDEDEPMSPRDWLPTGHDLKIAATVVEEFDGLG